MNSPIPLRRIAQINVLVVWLACFILQPIPDAFAVVPPPDGGYANFTTAEGTNALKSLTAGTANTGLGWFSLTSVTTGSFNTGVGAGTLVLNTGDANTATGVAALLFNTTGQQNTANGTAALLNNSSGGDNTAVGAFALNQGTGNGNTAVGSNALPGGNNATGNHNTAIGFRAGINHVTGSNNTYVGYLATGDPVESDTIRIGNGGNVATYIQGISGATAGTGAFVFVTSDGKLGTKTSSVRFKEDIKPMSTASEAILALRPVSFRYKEDIDPHSVPQFGLVAEEVAKVNPDLVIYDAGGEPYTVRYEQINAMLLNEFLKEHATVQELKEEIAALKTGLQKLSDQLKGSRSVQLAENRQ